MSKDTALKLYAVVRDKSKPYVDTGESEYFIHNFIVAAYSEEEALDMHPAFFQRSLTAPADECQDYMYSKNPEIFPDCMDMEWVKNPKEDAFAILIGYVSEEGLTHIKNQDVIALDSTNFM